jgi:large subunit ribosomal protein L24
MAMKIKKGDRVRVIAGKDKGSEGIVLRAIPSALKVIVEGINFAKKHVRPSMNDPKGGVKQVEAPVHVSNVMVVSAKDGRPVRVARRANAEGVRQRVSKKSGQVI